MSRPMGPRRVVVVLFVPCLLLPGSCSSPPSLERERRRGPKVNLGDFINNTAAYKGKAIMLDLKVDEPIRRSQGKSLQDYVGREVKFTAVGPKGDQLNLVITIPAGLAVPAVGQSEEVSVTFICTRGNLRQGNEARAIESP